MIPLIVYRLNGLSPMIHPGVMGGLYGLEGIGGIRFVNREVF